MKNLELIDPTKTFIFKREELSLRSAELRWLSLLLEVGDSKKYLIILSDKSRRDGLQHRIGFSEKIDFRRLVRLAHAGGFAVRGWSDLPPRSFISPRSVRVIQPPLQQATANWSCLVRRCCIRSTTDVRSLAGKPRGWSHAAGFIFLIFTRHGVPAGIALRASFPLHAAAYERCCALQHHVYIGIYIYIYICSRAQ